MAQDNSDLVGRVFTTSSGRPYRVTAVDRDDPAILFMVDLLVGNEGCILASMVRPNLVSLASA
jgi:hypothetical protein